eukprot:CAMPEP_0178634338 /NCGR_PEP_ID=MMETSP0698-20121128/12567_1 /TAXON_ID=265572 /ORGANISM="Extubocellulus spinifer, Strain CCMP396" /LENGTH=467 /DNA_ID=CAMNT_0020273979 /DNA_START=27 /DNA_END=1430 /DNA_ORIENTATION=+
MTTTTGDDQGEPTQQHQQQRLLLSITALKAVITACIFLSALLSVIAPLCIIHSSEAVFSIGNMMASGVLLAAALTHQLADASAALDSPDGYPWAMLVAGLTFIAFLILEESVHLLLGESSHDHDAAEKRGAGGAGGFSILAHAHTHGHNEHGHAGHDHSHQHIEKHDDKTGKQVRRQTSSSCSSSIRQEAKTASDQEGKNTTNNSNNNNNNNSFRRSYRTFSKVADADYFTDEDVLMEMKELDASAANGRRNRSHVGDGASGIVGSIMSAGRSILSYDQTTYSIHHHHDDHITQHLHGSTLASLMLFMALSLHSVLEGVAIGIVPQAEMVVSTSAAILAHKAFAGYALGSTIITAEGIDTQKHLMLGVLFSSTTPIGVLLGVALLNDFDEDSVAVGVVQAMVAGTFLYVAIVEVGMKELLVCRHGEEDAIDLMNSAGGGMSIKKLETLKLGFFLLGFLAMSGLAFFV